MGACYQCLMPDCGYVYDPQVGDEEGGIPPGTLFDDLPDEWRCPLCGGSKAVFVPLREH